MDRIGYGTRNELLHKAKELGIKGRWDMTKGQLIEAISFAQCDDVENEEAYKDTHTTQRTTLDYVKSLKKGAIVAFKVTLGGKERALSAKVMGRGPEEHFFVQTKNGSKYRIASTDIIWVKTGLRWPKWVLELLKGDAANAN